MRADDELLAAYCDGITELSLDERKRVERLLDDPAMRAEEAATRSVLGAVRALPSRGSEPDWTAMERAIRDEVGPVVPRQWWRMLSWRWLVPITGLATAATVLVLATSDTTQRQPATANVVNAGVAAVREPDVVMMLDGESIVLTSDEDVKFELESDALGPDDIHTEDAIDGDLLTGDLAWIDQLDDESVQVADAWLDERKKS